MRFAKALVAAAMCWAGQAQAAKVWEQNFTITPDTPYFAARPDIGAGQQQMVLRFSAPVTGTADLPGFVNKYVYDHGQLEWANDIFGVFGANFSNATTVKFDAGCRTYSSIPYRNSYCSWQSPPPNFYLNLIGLDSPVTVRAAVWASAPEPTTWLMLIFGFGGVGLILRRVNSRYVHVPAP